MKYPVTNIQLDSHGRISIGSRTSEENEYQILNFINMIFNGIIKGKSYQFAIHNLKVGIDKLSVKPENLEYQFNIISEKSEASISDKLIQTNVILSELIELNPGIERWIRNKD